MSQHNMTKAQTRRALEILSELSADPIVPDFVTANEADLIARERYGITSSRFGRVAKDRRYSHCVNLAQLAVEVAKKEVK